MPTLAKVDADKIRSEIQAIAGELERTRMEAETKIVRLANLVYEVQRHQLFRQWNDAATGKPFTTFDTWIKAEVKQSKVQVYRLIGVREHLKDVPDETLEKLGNSKCFELARVAKSKPSFVPRLLKELEKRPDMPVYELQQRVSSMLSDGRYDSKAYERYTFAVRVEDVPFVEKALLVENSIEPVTHFDSDSGRGSLLVAICQDFITDEHNRKRLAQLEEAGAFGKNAAFKIQDE